MTLPLPMTAEDIVASAVATSARTVDDDGEVRPLVARAAYERAKTLAAALQAGVSDRDVYDHRCRRHLTIAGLIRHCAVIDHTIRDVELLDVEVDERWLGRQGESRTAVASW